MVGTFAIDGTFKLCPIQWTQLVCIHALEKDFSVPLIFGLLPNKSEHTYDRFLLAVKDLLPKFEPDTYICDFEKSMHNSLSKVFDSLNIKGCLFHLSQWCWRKIYELGCRNQYNTDDEFKLLMKSFCALAFLKTDKVISAFEQLADNDNSHLPLYPTLSVLISA